MIINSQTCGSSQASENYFRSDGCCDAPVEKPAWSANEPNFGAPSRGVDLLGRIGKGLTFAGSVLLFPIAAMLSITGCGREEDGDGPDAGGLQAGGEADPGSSMYQYGGSIFNGVDWADATAVTDPKQRHNLRASGRLETPVGRCSAQIIARDLVITNHHCVPDQGAANGTTFFPRSESGVSGDEFNRTSFRCDQLVATDCAHDVSIVRCRRNEAVGELPGDVYGAVPIDVMTQFTKGQQIYLIHTNCDYRSNDCAPVKLLSPGSISDYEKSCIRFEGENGCNCRSTVPQGYHKCDILPGSSGGGVYDAVTHRLIGLVWGESNVTNLASSLAHLYATNPTFANILQPLIPCYDDDGDGYGSENNGTCASKGVDCDDTNPAIHPGAAESCDGIDTNCNGDLDDVTQLCGSDVGECRKGVQRCSVGKWLDACEGEVGPADEVCDDKDNDCDGAVDEELLQICGSDVGECRTGVQSCFRGDWQECIGEVRPAPEYCDGLDNDCDGEIDDGVDPMTEPSAKCPDKGICSDGGAQAVCAGGEWSCEMPAGYIEEECPVVDPICGRGSPADPACGDGLDNDCDGVTDEHSVAATCQELPDFWRIAADEPCFVKMLGECGEHGGVYRCVELAEGCGVALDCEGAQFPEKEICDGLDNDCDGAVDEDGVCP